MNIYYLQIILFITFAGINLCFYLLAFPVWAYPGLAAFYFLTNLIYLKEIIGQGSAAAVKDTAPPLHMQKYLDELQTAQKVQQGLLSVEKPNLSGIKIAKRCVPAKNVGGDFFTFIHKDGQSLKQEHKSIPGVIEYVDTKETSLGVVIGDVAGHGVSSALVMALASGLLGEVGKNTLHPAETLKIVNNDLLNYIENSQISHVTAFYSLINIHSKKMNYVKAGHLPALLVHQDNTSELLKTDGLFLGMFPNEEYEEKETQLYSGDRLFLFTDGIVETRNAEDEEFGLERLTAIILSNHFLDIEALLALIFKEVAEYAKSSEITDDQTLVIVEVE